MVFRVDGGNSLPSIAPFSISRSSQKAMGLWFRLFTPLINITVLK